MKTLTDSKTKLLSASVILTVVVLGSFGVRDSMSSEDKSESKEKKNQISDQRELLPVPFKIRNKLLHKMNQDNLGSVGKMLEALSKDDLAEVARLANELSYSDKTEKFSKRRGSVAFAVMATEFHGQKMPAIREAAEDGDKNEVLRRMGQAVSSCVNCHSATRLVEWPTDRSYSVPEPVSLPESTPSPRRQIPDYKYNP
ncbi:MAG: hypothetical protein ACLFQT_07780 [Thiohalophilus sp.]